MVLELGAFPRRITPNPILQHPLRRVASLEECKKLRNEKKATQGGNQEKLTNDCEQKFGFTVKEIEPHIPFLVQSKIYDALDRLQDLGFLTSYLDDKTDSKRPVRRYEPVDFDIGTFPTWKEIVNCRKKGNEGIEGKEVIKGNEGNDNNNRRKKSKKHKVTMINNNTNNSLNSLNSPPKLAYE